MRLLATPCCASWDVHVQRRLGDKGGAYTASVVAADGKIYFTSEDGDVFVVKAGSKYELLASNPMGEVLMATPAISDGMIFVRGLKHLFAIAEASAPAASLDGKTGGPESSVKTRTR
ncbi:MAG: PQQ-binding-like beta-propeller repeat protein [Acidobacteria bacterium]|nr:PQQ-binding-like beta-propeller repeat protein [Acidobacteriota bacterium]